MCGGLPCVRKFKSQRKQNQRNRRSLHRRVKITNELLFKLFVYFLIAKRFINNQGGPSAETMEAAVADVNVLSPGSPRGVRSDSDYSSYSSYSTYSSYSYSCTPPRTAGLEAPLPSEPAVAETAGAARLPAMPDAGPVAPQAPPSTFQLSKGAAPFWPGVEIVAPGSAVTPPTAFASTAEANATLGWRSLVNFALHVFYDSLWDEASDRVAECARLRRQRRRVRIGWARLVRKACSRADPWS